MRSSHHDFGLGIVLGSNVFNLAGLLGLSAIVAGKVAIGRRGLLLNGGVGLLVTVVVCFLLWGWLPPLAALGIMAVLIVPYIRVCSLRPAEVLQLSIPPRTKGFLAAAIRHLHRAGRRPVAGDGLWINILAVVLSTALVVAASVFMVESGVAVANDLGLSHAIIGTLILAALTSIPNLIVAVRLAREGRGEAVVSESFNSNTLNAGVGICMPAVIFGLGQPAPEIVFCSIWLLGMTAFAIAATITDGGLKRGGTAILITLYLIFVVAIAIWK